MIAMALGILGAAGTSTDEPTLPPSARIGLAPAAVVNDPTASPVPSSTAVVGPMPVATPELTPDLLGAKRVDLAPLDTFVVGSEGAGISRPAAKGQAARLEIPV
ncbi:MAG: hypothetical protein ACI9TF_001005 [Paracrocinitomix sp.]|jgi:hypothetical protein